MRSVCLLFALLLAGCEERYPVYSSFDQNEFNLSCLDYAVYDKKDRELIQKHFNIPHNPQCDYRVELTKYHVGSCNNPVVKSLGSDFDGYVRLEIKKGFKCYYKVQCDYKSDANGAFERIVKKAKEELRISK